MMFAMSWKGLAIALVIVAVLFAGLLWLLTSFVIDFAPATRKTPQEFAKIARSASGTLEEIHLTSSDGVKTAAWILPAERSQDAARWGVVLSHGGGDDKSYYLELGEHLRDRGFDVIMPDLRGAGESDASPAGMTLGITEGRDVAAAAAFLVDRKGVDRIAAIGVSMGGVASVMGASLEPRIGPLIIESSSFRAERVFDFMLGRFGLPEGRLRSAIGGLVTQVGVWRMGGTWLDIREGVLPTWRLAGDLAAWPVLFIYGDKDPLVHREDIALFRQRFAGPTRVLVASETGHGVYRPRKGEYTQAATRFLEDWRAGQGLFAKAADGEKHPAEEAFPGV